MGDEDALSMVFFNLIINSALVQGPNGKHVERIKVEPCLEVLKNRALQGVDTGNYYVLCLVDDGPGITSDLREKVFEPFFSRRKSGFGLGLALVHRIVHALGGYIYVDECPWRGKGAAFFIALPRPDQPLPKAAHPEPSGGKQTAGRIPQS